MERDDIIRMAHEADCLDEQHYGSVWATKLERFARLVAAAERKAILELCEDWHFEAEDPLEVAKAIRAREQNEQG